MVMGTKKKSDPAVDQEQVPEGTAYDLRTPLWSKYYAAMRKRVRFPRYYKKAVNW